VQPAARVQCVLLRRQCREPDVHAGRVPHEWADLAEPELLWAAHRGREKCRYSSLGHCCADGDTRVFSCWELLDGRHEWDVGGSEVDVRLFSFCDSMRF
jgi:hypothetical protein